MFINFEHKVLIRKKIFNNTLALAAIIILIHVQVLFPLQPTVERRFMILPGPGGMTIVHFPFLVGFIRCFLHFHLKDQS